MEKVLMEFIFNSTKKNAGFKSYVLDGICTKIVENNHEITDDDIRILYQLYGQSLLKALELIDKGCIELITISDSDRQYFSNTPKRPYLLLSLDKYNIVEFG